MLALVYLIENFKICYIQCKRTTETSIGSAFILYVYGYVCFSAVGVVFVKSRLLWLKDLVN